MNDKVLCRVLFTSFCMVAFATQAFGFNSTIATTDIGYDFYNMAMTMSNGAIGRTLGIFGLIWLLLAWLIMGQFNYVKGWIVLMGLIGFAKLPSMLDTFGCTF
jgi:hypothetical protein